jgi:hypothetical protein
MAKTRGSFFGFSTRQSNPTVRRRALRCEPLECRWLLSVDSPIGPGPDDPPAETGSADPGSGGDPIFQPLNEVALVVVPVNVTAANQNSLTVGGTGHPDAVVTLTISDVGNVHVITPPTATVLGDGTWSISNIDVSTLNEGTITFNVSAPDVDGNGPTSDSKTAVKDAVNDPPSGADSPATTLEDTPLTLTREHFGFTDPNDDSLLSVKITTLPTAGSLTLNNAAIAAGAFVTVADIDAGNLKFVPAQNANGLSYSSFTFQVRDDGGGNDLDPTPNTLTINVTAVNDAPAGTDKPLNITQDTFYTFAVSDFGFKDDADASDSLKEVVITQLPTAGSLTLDGAAVEVNDAISAEAITAGKLRFTPQAGAQGSPYATFQFKVRDNGSTDNQGVNLDPSANTITFNVTPLDTTAPTVQSIVRIDSNPTNAGQVHFRVTFSENVTNVNRLDFNFAKPGEGNSIAGENIPVIDGVVGSDSVYTVTVNTGSGSGKLGLNFVDRNTITDSAGNKVGGPVLGDGNLASDPAQQYDIDKVVPTVTQIALPDPNPTKASSVTFDVRLGEPVTGVDASDFQLDSTVSGAIITGVSGSGDEYTVTVSTGTGEGTIRLIVLSDGTIKDVAGNTIPTGLTSPQAYTIDRTSPTVLSITPIGNTTTTDIAVQFLVTFSDSVTGVDSPDFKIVTTGGVVGATVTNVTGNGATRTVTVNTGSGNGTIGLNLVDDNTIVDLAGSPLGGNTAGDGNFTGGTFTVNRNNGLAGFVFLNSGGPVAKDASDVPLQGVVVTLHGFDTINNRTVSQTAVTDATGFYRFSNLVPGTYSISEAKPGDLNVPTSSAGGAGGTGAGLDITDITVDNNTDATNYNFGHDVSATMLNLNFYLTSTPTASLFFNNLVSDQPTVGPVVMSLNRLDPDPTSASSVRFGLTLNKDVTGVDVTDFSLLTGTGASGGTVSGVQGSGSSYTITVTTGGTDGKVHLGVIDDDTIVDKDGTALGGSGSGNGNFFGQFYTFDKP